MPLDKSSGSRPLIPPLSTTAKVSSRSPLTPRIAASAPAPASKPLTRRAARSEKNGTPHVATSKEDISTPVSTFLSQNITPRSGSRKSRVDSTNTTPSNTPSGTPAPSDGSGLDIAGYEKKDGQKHGTVSFSPTISDGGFTYSRIEASAESKFFFANDARAAVQNSRPSRPQPPVKSSSFFYANGEAIPGAPVSSSASAVASAIGTERHQPKFFHADGNADVSTPHIPPLRPQSNVSSTSRLTSPRLAATDTYPLQRPLSPQKNVQQLSPALKNTPALPSPLTSRPCPSERGHSASSVTPIRTVSIECKQRILSHKRCASADPSDASSMPSKRLSGGTSPGPAHPSDLITGPGMTLTPDEVAEEDESTLASTLSDPPSTSKTRHSIRHISELAANARRERKVLDLEITNSSLTAINRSLEREMRKQAVELRRYRRLSRAGRLSLATTPSLRNFSADSQHTSNSLDDAGLSDLSEEPSEEEEPNSSEDESMDDESLTPSAMAESDLRHRKKDEERLQLDLSKHQQLLVDSQKLNQSLKRCLGWTEELINEGQKALNYRVRVSDMEFGGRVLVPDEVDDADNEGMSEVGSTVLNQVKQVFTEEPSAWGGAGKDDRDSGIELGTSHRDSTTEHTRPI